MKIKPLLLLLILNPVLCISAPPVEELPWINGKDSETLSYVSPFLPSNPVIIEAGVCDGADTVKMKKLWPKSTIYGFEPLPDHYKLAKNRTKRKKGVHLFPIALFDRVGNITFYKSAKISGASSLLKDNLDHIDFPDSINHGGGNYQDTPLTVSCTTVDQWAENNNVKRVDYFWLDTEGAELPILENATTILPNVKVISIEVNFQEFRLGMTQFSDLYDFLESYGFTLKYIWGNPEWQGVAVFVNEANCL